MQPHHTPQKLDGSQRVAEQLDTARKVAERRQPQQRAREDLRAAPVLRVQPEQRRLTGGRVLCEYGSLAFDSPGWTNRFFCFALLRCDVRLHRHRERHNPGPETELPWLTKNQKSMGPFPMWRNLGNGRVDPAT